MTNQFLVGTKFEWRFPGYPNEYYLAEIKSFVRENTYRTVYIEQYIENKRLGWKGTLGYDLNTLKKHLEKGDIKILDSKKQREYEELFI